MNIKILRNRDVQWMLFGLVGMYFTSCKNDNTINPTGKLFSLKTPPETGVQFNNKLTETKELNAFKFNYMYNGAGVGIGDINNDGLQDLYFVGNQVPDKLYLNKGNLRFEDISESSGIAAFGGWKNGITFVDINQDGYLDIYITRGGFIDDPNLNSNLLFVNQKNLQFKEEAR
ncbi:MAG: VCBS repeat-containing protein, partial [Saprospiraceae bacterium]